MSKLMELLAENPVLFTQLVTSWAGALAGFGTLCVVIANYIKGKARDVKLDHVIEKTPSKELIEENTAVTKENTEVTQKSQQLIQTGSFTAFKKD